MREPGASDVLMCFCTVKPASTAFFASRPAANSTPGLLVLVHDVIAAINTSPSAIATPAALGCRDGLHQRPIRLHLDHIARRAFRSRRPRTRTHAVVGERKPLRQARCRAD